MLFIWNTLWFSHNLQLYAKPTYMEKDYVDYINTYVKDVLYTHYYYLLTQNTIIVTNRIE